MRIPCPICGERDRREFYYVGDAKIVNRPSPDASEDLWNDYLHNRDNPAGGDFTYTWLEITHFTMN